MRIDEMKRAAGAAGRLLSGLALLGAIGCQGGKADGGSSAAPASSESAGAAPASSGSASAAPAAASASAAAAGSVAGSALVPPPVPPVPDVSLTSADVLKVMNPKGQAPYSGPVGTLRGRVSIQGDPPPDSGLSFPVGKCGEAAATYGRLFRVGQDSALADALVTVVNYDGYVPEREEAEKVTIQGCAFSSRTVAVSYGQRVEVSNLDSLEPYMPILDGAPFTAVLVAMPRGDAVKFNPLKPGYYELRDSLPKPFLKAGVFVLKFATHDVTGLDGRYEIKGIPVGKVLTAALLPAIDQDVKKAIEIKEGDNTLDFQFTFDLAKWKAKGAKKSP
jgi:hypothetical protein